MRNRVYFCIVLVLACNIIFAQDFKRLQLGDECPDLVLTGSDNGNNEFEVKLSSLRGKLVLLDFWSLFCSSCIAAFPKMEELQKQFDQEIVVLLVNNGDEKEKTESRLKKIFSKSQYSMPELPRVYGSTELLKLFPHRYVPHHVWIDQDGRVASITAGYNSTPAYVNSLLKGEPLDVHQKTDLPDLDPTNGFLGVTDKRLQPMLINYSALFGYIDGYGGGIRNVTGKNYVKKIYYNNSIAQLFKSAHAIGDNRYLQFRNRLILNVKNRGRFSRPEDPSQIDAWKAANTFTYEVRVPSPYRHRISYLMQEDLNRQFGFLFGITAGVEKRLMDCLVLKISDSTRSKTGGGSPGVEISDLQYQQVNKTAWNISFFLARQFQNQERPLISDLKDDMLIDVLLQAPFTNLEIVNKQLAKSGLQLIEEKRVVPMLIITESESNNSNN